MPDTVLSLLLSYVLGSVSGSLLLGRLKGVDIRQSGSGNAGGTNALRTQGFWFALGVVIIDVGKGVIAAGLLPELNLFGGADDLSARGLAFACGGMAVLGHCFPVFHGFRGGKGVATLMGTLLVLTPGSLPLFFATWAVCVVITGWVGLGSMLAVASLIPSAVWLGGPNDWPFTIFAVVMTLFIAAMHHSNIRNMLDGTEYHFERIMIKNWFRKSSG